LVTGFTLIEVILYLAIAGTVLYFISGFSFNAIFDKSKIEVLQDVDQTSQLIFDDINSTISEAIDFTIL
jgi:Tfp pilus assembly protein PilE